MFECKGSSRPGHVSNWDQGLMERWKLFLPGIYQGFDLCIMLVWLSWLWTQVRPWSKCGSLC